MTQQAGATKRDGSKGVGFRVLYGVPLQLNFFQLPFSAWVSFFGSRTIHELGPESPWLSTGRSYLYLSVCMEGEYQAQ